MSKQADLVILPAIKRARKGIEGMAVHTPLHFSKHLSTLLGCNVEPET